MTARCGARFHGFGMMEDELGSGHFYLLLMQTPVCWVYCMHTAAGNVLQRASVGPQGVVLEWRAACFWSAMLPIISHFYAHVKLIRASNGTTAGSLHPEERHKLHELLVCNAK